jgi:hypothetical protein
MPEPAVAEPDDFEAAVDDAIAECSSNMREALRELIAAYR